MNLVHNISRLSAAGHMSDQNLSQNQSWVSTATSSDNSCQEKQSGISPEFSCTLSMSDRQRPFGHLNATCKTSGKAINILFPHARRLDEFSLIEKMHAGITGNVKMQVSQMRSK
ncbi:hypothetical protein AVEN_115136-1 [Araneus ventricosus]|uniref:Uncharacterized protein n=1 Tax=Araneus ventricosus TaxID=182803 RepID=A0A4Y1ZZ67_ARAVE|nr:hypothetical protein AVEN_115136-1 [Araneus ventricosus]